MLQMEYNLFQMHTIRQKIPLVWFNFGCSKDIFLIFEFYISDLI